MKQIFHLCAKYLREKQTSIIVLVLVSLINNSIILLIPYLTGNFVDKLLLGYSYSFFLRFVFWFLIIGLAEIISNFFSSRIYIKLQTEMSFELNKDVVEHFQNLPLNYVLNQDTASLIQKINNDSNSLIVYCLSLLQQITVYLLKFFLAFGFMFLQDKTLTLGLLFISFFYLGAYCLLKKHIHKASYVLKEKQAAFFNSLFEQINQIKFIQLHGLNSIFINRLDCPFSATLNAALKYQRTSYLFAGVDKLISIGSTALIFYLGGSAVIKGNMTIGVFTIFASYFAIMISALKYFFQIGQLTQENIVSCDRIKKILNIQEQKKGDIVPREINRISIKNLSFSYDNNLIFDNFSFQFEKGKIFALTGKNGSGKSTLIDIIVGLHIEKCKGVVLYDNCSIEKLDMPKVRRYFFGVSEQEPPLLRDTIKYNLFLSSENFPNNIFLQLCELFGMKDFIAHLPQGLDSIVNEKSTNLSGGEKQKVSLLRAMLHCPNVLILDEPTSALDKESKNRLIQYLRTKLKNSIIILSTHDNELAKLCDVQLKL